MLFSQAKLAGSASLETSYTSYTEESDIWNKQAYDQVVTNAELDPSIYNYENYSRSLVVPGLKERLNLALFYFTPKWKVAFYSKISNSDWIQPNELRYIDRVSLNVSFGKQKLTIGDTYINSAEYFITNRRLRGVSADVTFLQESKEYDLGLKAFSGISEYRTDIGDPVTSRYQSYYSINRYQRNFSGAELTSELFDDMIELRLGYLTGEDDATGNVDTLSTRPLNNTVSGGTVRFNFVKKQVYLFGEMYSSTKDSVFTTHTNSGETRNSSHYGLGVKTDQLLLNFSLYSIDPDYYTFGQPYLINDREGFRANAKLNFSDKLNLSAKIDFYDTNIDKNPAIATLTNRQLDLGAGLPITDNIKIDANYLRLTDSGNGAENTSIFRVSNTIDFGASYTMEKGKITARGGFSNTTDNSIYGYTETEDGFEAIRGVNSSRDFYSLSGYYNFSNTFSTTISMNMNIIEQETVDETQIFTMLFSSNYSMPEEGLKFVLFGQYNYSDNSLANGLLLQELTDATRARYRLFSAINKYTNNFVDFSTEYLFTYAIRAKLGVRYEAKTYRYLEDQFANTQSIIDEMVALSNPNFLNQRESYSAMVFTIGLSYLL